MNLSLKVLLLPEGMLLGLVLGKNPRYILGQKFIIYIIFILVRLSIIMFNPDFVTPEERERRRLAKIKIVKGNRTITIPMQHWITLDLIFEKLGKSKNLKSSTTNSDTVRYCIEQIGIEEGLES